jgi:VIT1/CCC1 family predicted Fe2+/Mn2+ transporter
VIAAVLGVILAVATFYLLLVLALALIGALWFHPIALLVLAWVLAIIGWTRRRWMCRDGGSSSRSPR